jgi:hypothetical protein
LFNGNWVNFHGSTSLFNVLTSAVTCVGLNAISSPETCT